jgi:hypothetical protein
MPRVGFEPTIPVLERVKTVHALDRAASVIGSSRTTEYKRVETGGLDKMSDIENKWTRLLKIFCAT